MSDCKTYNHIFLPRRKYISRALRSLSLHKQLKDRQTKANFHTVTDIMKTDRNTIPYQQKSHTAIKTKVKYMLWNTDFLKIHATGTKYWFINHTFNKHNQEIRVTILSNTNLSNENTVLQDYSHMRDHIISKLRLKFRDRFITYDFCIKQYRWKTHVHWLTFLPHSSMKICISNTLRTHLQIHLILHLKCQFTIQS